MNTGEPVTGKLVRRVRERADGKGPEPRAPRRRPISLGGRPHGKGSAPQTPRRAAHPSVKVAGCWVYLYRAIDQYGQVIDVLMSEKRDLAATRRFFARALDHGTYPSAVTTDKHRPILVC
jgi:hypothetical protein